MIIIHDIQTTSILTVNVREQHIYRTHANTTKPNKMLVNNIVIITYAEIMNERMIGWSTSENQVKQTFMWNLGIPIITQIKIHLDMSTRTLQEDHTA